MAMAILIGTLGQTMSNSQIFSFMAGTLIGTFTTAARKTGTRIAIFYLSLLTSAQQSAVLDNAERLAGGLPRLIGAFITAILAAQPNGVTFNDIRKPTGAFELARPLVDAIVLRKPVQSNWSVLPGHPDTQESLQQDSQIVLQANPLDVTLFIPTMLSIAFQSLVRTAKEKCDFADGNHYLNVPGAWFSDGSSVCGEAIDDMLINVTNSSEDEDMDNDDDSGRSPTRRPSKLCIAEQYKDQQSIMTSEKCIDEHEKNKDNWENAGKIESKDDYRLITVIISTGKVAPHKEDQYISQDNLKDLLVVDVTMLEVFYGILERLLRLLQSTETHRLAVNTAD
ncbi:hypothetical protein BDR22DRAFT_825735 [Usnea florida]